MDAGYDYEPIYEQIHRMGQQSVIAYNPFSLKDCLCLIDDLGVPNSEIRLSGGGAKSTLWRQIFSDIFNQKIHRIHANEGPAFGADLLAGAGTNVYSSVEEACSQTVNFYDSIEPITNNVEKYSNYYSIYKELYFNYMKHSLLCINWQLNNFRNS